MILIRGVNSIWDTDVTVKHITYINLSRDLRVGAVQVWDVRSFKRSGEIEGAHHMPVRDIDFAQHQQHRIVTAGDDGKLRFWDLRYVVAPGLLL